MAYLKTQIIHTLCTVHRNQFYKQTRCTFCMYLFYNLCTTLHVSNDYLFHHQEFINLLYLQLCTNHAETLKQLLLIYIGKSKVKMNKVQSVVKNMQYIFFKFLIFILILLCYIFLTTLYTLSILTLHLSIYIKSNCFNVSS